MKEGRERLIGKSTAIRQLQEEAECAAVTDAKVLITGESGVGKEVLAGLIHSSGSRRNARLLTINCAGLPDSLLESELFGHVRGSFTGAYRDKAGLLELADGGTIFMDEVGEMSLRMQALLLRFLETGEIHRVGADSVQKGVDVRVIAATNRDLAARIASREFREDLYFRLNVIRLNMPPLRERREDIQLLLDHFLASYCARYSMAVPLVTPEAMTRLVNYHWPGNVRELKNVVERLTLRRKSDAITPADLPSEIVPVTRPRLEIVRPQYGETLFDRIVKHGESFWTAAYEPFMSRDLTRDDLRRLVALGLEQTRGNYRVLVEYFRMPPTDYKRFLNFLRKYECQVPFQQFRTASASLPDRAGGSPGKGPEGERRGAAGAR